MLCNLNPNRFHEVPNVIFMYSWKSFTLLYCFFLDPRSKLQNIQKRTYDIYKPNYQVYACAQLCANCMNHAEFSCRILRSVRGPSASTKQFLQKILFYAGISGFSKQIFAFSSKNATFYLENQLIMSKSVTANFLGVTKILTYSRKYVTSTQKKKYRVNRSQSLTTLIFCLSIRATCLPPHPFLSIGYFSCR